MPRKLKVYQTSQGFYDLAIAVPSMKAALEAWGANSNLFHQGVAYESKDDDVIVAAMKKPGVVLQRPVGSDKPFKEHSELPTAASLDAMARHAGAKPVKETPTEPKLDKMASEKAAAAYEKERKRQEKQRLKKEAAEAKERDRREAAVSKAEANLREAQKKHVEIIQAIEGEREELDKQARAEEKRREAERERLERRPRKNRTKPTSDF
jgi:type IV secretory pathway VirB10-like protein